MQLTLVTQYSLYKYIFPTYMSLIHNLDTTTSLDSINSTILHGLI